MACVEVSLSPKFQPYETISDPDSTVEASEVKSTESPSTSLLMTAVGAVCGGAAVTPTVLTPVSPRSSVTLRVTV